MSPNTITLLIVIASVLAGLIIITLWILTRSKKEQPSQASVIPPQASDVPEFINDPPEARENTAPVDIQPFRMETPLPKTAEEGSQKIRILVVDDKVGTSENVRRIIYFEEDMEVNGKA